MTHADENEYMTKDGKVAESDHTKTSPCVDLRSWAVNEGRLTSTSSHDNGLCGVCRLVNLRRLLRIQHECEPTHYHLGRIDDILKETTCALCRLISHIYNSTNIEWSNADPGGHLECTLLGKWIRNVRLNDPELSSQFEGHANYVDLFAIECSFAFTNGFSQSGAHVIQIDENTSDWIAPSECDQMRPSIGRTIPSNQVDFSLFRHWLKLCEDSHGDVCHRSDDHRDTNTGDEIRLIDVQQLCVVNSSTKDRYLALSYVWGGALQVTLNRQNYACLTIPNGIRLEDLPTTIADALNVVIQMGERYLWVDRLCILHDDERDTMQQLSNIANIYGNATLTIIAACTVTADMPLCGVEPNTRPVTQLSEIVDGVQFVTGQPNALLSLSETCWSTRGWTFQESFLSPRCLIFTRYQVYFQCRSASWCEDSCYESWLRPSSTFGNGLCDTDGMKNTAIQLCNADRIVIVNKRCPLFRYTDAVENYSGRTLSKDSDALWAFSGVTQALEPQFPRSFAWGMPIACMDAALLWYSVDRADAPRLAAHKFVQGPHVVEVSFPSWSWLSRRGRVEHFSKCEGDVQSLVEWHEPLTMTLEPTLQTWKDLTNSDGVYVSTYQESGQSLVLPVSEHQLGLIRFTTLSASFDFNPREGDFTEDQTKKCTCRPNNVSCNIKSPKTGEIVGEVLVLRSWLQTSKRQDQKQPWKGEFILLSKQAERSPLLDHLEERQLHVTKPKSEGQDEHTMYYAMLVDWKDSARFGRVASRVGLAKIQQNHWLQASTTRKTIVLN